MFDLHGGLLMLFSMIIRLAMIGATAGAVFWIGWTLPPARVLTSEAISPSDQLDRNVLPATGPLPQSRTTFEAPGDKRRTRSPGPLISRTLDLNLASERDLEQLPGIGPVLAVRIVEYRESRGAFRDVEQLRHVKGIGKKTFDRIRALVGVTSSLTMQPRGKAA